MSKLDYPDWSDEKSGKRKVKFYQKVWAPWAAFVVLVILLSIFWFQALQSR
jgi:hypothetical protein